ncbi:hypothetical protein GIB67_023554 [Kingdonia uniflora]|uniref:S-protein homolog n=1 Tax=Kingdonia uniflora TaxID=39325 RepID=A0A7J7PA81_9MAGN|nr:hypothetical protein GIB67_023554 [Kingdonia uniflora]
MYIENALYPGTPLNVHCKSKDENLPQLNIPYTKIYYWEFETNWFTTLYWCSIWWRDGHGKWVHKTFDAYKIKFAVWVMCETSCYWTARPDGIYFAYDGHHPKLIYNWEY